MIMERIKLGAHIAYSAKAPGSAGMKIDTKGLLIKIEELDRLTLFARTMTPMTYSIVLSFNEDNYKIFLNYPRNHLGIIPISVDTSLDSDFTSSYTLKIKNFYNQRLAKHYYDKLLTICEDSKIKTPDDV